MNVYCGSQWWSKEAREQGFPRQGFRVYYTPQLEFYHAKHSEQARSFLKHCMPRLRREIQIGL